MYDDDDASIFGSLKFKKPSKNHRTFADLNQTNSSDQFSDESCNSADNTMRARKRLAKGINNNSKQVHNLVQELKFKNSNNLEKFKK